VATGEQPPAKVGKEIAMSDFQLLPKLFCRLLLLLEIGIDLNSVGEIIGDDTINLSEGKRGEVLANLLRSASFPKSVDHTVQRDASASNTPRSLWSTGKKVRESNPRIHKSDGNLNQERKATAAIARYVLYVQ
jgi:hypothetical protein